MASGVVLLLLALLYPSAAMEEIVLTLSNSKEAMLGAMAESEGGRNEWTASV